MIVPNGAGHLEIRELSLGWGGQDDFEVARAMWLSKLGVKPDEKAEWLGIALGGPVPLSMFEQASTFRDHQLDDAGISEAECPRGQHRETIMLPASSDELLLAARLLAEHAANCVAFEDQAKETHEAIFALAPQLMREAYEKRRVEIGKAAREFAAEKARRIIAEAEKDAE